MGNLAITEFITLDGVIEDPGGQSGWDRGGCDACGFSAGATAGIRADSSTVFLPPIR